MRDFSKLKLVSSNQKKLDEYQQLGLIGLELHKGLDLPEIDDPTPEMVAIYKSISAGPGLITEDTTFEVVGTDINADVKFRMSEIADHVGKDAVFTVVLAENDGTHVHLYIGRIHGRITDSAPVQEGSPVFGFDNNFTPNGVEQNLYQLALMGQKHDYSARRIAAEMLMAGTPSGSYDLHRISDWQGAYQ